MFLKVPNEILCDDFSLPLCRAMSSSKHISKGPPQLGPRLDGKGERKCESVFQCLVDYDGVTHSVTVSGPNNFKNSKKTGTGTEQLKTRFFPL